MKKLLKVFIALLIAAVIGFTAIFVLPWALIGLGILLSPNPAKPEITYGEFPFEIVYEVDGEVVTVNDVYICKYSIGMNEGVGKYRNWKGSIKGTGEDGLFVKEIDGKKIYCSVGWPEYYMDDPDDSSTDVPEPGFYIIEANDMGGTTTYGIEDESLHEYNIKVISYKFSDPIENSFETQRTNTGDGSLQSGDCNQGTVL